MREEAKREFSGTIYQAEHLTPFAAHCCQRKSAYKTPLGGVARGKWEGAGVDGVGGVGLGQVRIVDQTIAVKMSRSSSGPNLLRSPPSNCVLLVIVSIVNSHDLRVDLVLPLTEACDKIETERQMQSREENGKG